MRLFAYLAAVAAAFHLSGCVSSSGTPYAPADSQGYGYSETQIEEDRFRITFRGDGGTPIDVVENYALLRAAELARENGYDWFRVVAGGTTGEERGGVGVGGGVGTGSFGRRSSVGVGVGGDFGRIGARELYTSRIEVLFGSGEIPEEGEVYDARSVIASANERAGLN
ncbi:MAG: hypothetical protein AAGC56_04690 [Pseudomonadota bacterium]